MRRRSDRCSIFIHKNCFTLRNPPDSLRRSNCRNCIGVLLSRSGLSLRTIYLPARWKLLALLWIARSRTPHTLPSSAARSRQRKRPSRSCAASRSARRCTSRGSTAAISNYEQWTLHSWRADRPLLVGLNKFSHHSSLARQHFSLACKSHPHGEIK
jgi:hypothetical protein